MSHAVRISGGCQGPPRGMPVEGRADGRAEGVEARQGATGHDRGQGRAGQGQGRGRSPPRASGRQGQGGRRAREDGRREAGVRQGRARKGRAGRGRQARPCRGGACVLSGGCRREVGRGRGGGPKESFDPDKSDIEVQTRAPKSDICPRSKRANRTFRAGKSDISPKQIGHSGQISTANSPAKVISTKHSLFSPKCSKIPPPPLFSRPSHPLRIFPRKNVQVHIFCHFVR